MTEPEKAPEPPPEPLLDWFSPHRGPIACPACGAVRTGTLNGKPKFLCDCP